MEILNIESLIAQGKILKASELDSQNDYLIIGKYQTGNRKKAGDFNAYPAYVIKAGDFSTPKIFAEFSDKLTQSTPNANEASAIELNSSASFNSPEITTILDTNNKLTIINFSKPGIYNVEFNIQIARVSTGLSNDNVRLWIRQNGINISRTLRVINIQRNVDESEIILSGNYFIEIQNINDTVQLMWNTTDRNVVLQPIPGAFAQPDVRAYPDGYSVLVTINKVN
jgi:hypothetical protein